MKIARVGCVWENMLIAEKLYKKKQSLPEKILIQSKRTYLWVHILSTDFRSSSLSSVRCERALSVISLITLRIFYCFQASHDDFVVRDFTLLDPLDMLRRVLFLVSLSALSRLPNELRIWRHRCIRCVSAKHTIKQGYNPDQRTS